MAIAPKKITIESISDIVLNVNGRVCEMSGDTQLINVPVNPRIDINTITADDPTPRFVNVEVIRAGISGNRKRYTNNIVKEISELVPGCQGFFGHPDPSKYGFEFREPQCIYVGSVVETMADGIDRCIAKAYIFKTSALREWIPKSIAAGNPMTVSINATADVMRGSDLIDVVHINELQSIDWANPGTEGMANSKAMSVVSEQQQKGGENMEFNVKEVLKNATVTEFKAFNKEGYESIIKDLKVTELSLLNPSLVESIKETAKVTEMEFLFDGKQETIKLSEMQGKINAYESKITELEGKIKSTEIESYKKDKISESIPENLREMVSKRINANTKEDIDSAIKAEVQYIKEMGRMNNKPIGRTLEKLDNDESAKIMRSIFGAKESDK